MPLSTLEICKIGPTYQAAQSTTMRVATKAAILAMMRTKRSSSRCRVVILFVSIEDSLAMTPLKQM